MTREDEEDMTDMVVEPAKLLPVPKGKPAQPNPLAEHLERTWKEGPLGVVRNAKDAVSVGHRIRKIAMNRKHSVTVQYHVLPGETYVAEAKVGLLDPDSKVRVVFQARKRQVKVHDEGDE
jgi:hypothetical protein